MRRAWLPAATLGMVMIGLVGQSYGAKGARERLAITRLEFSANIPLPLRKSLNQRLSEGLTAVSFEVRGTERPSPGGSPLCEDPVCYMRLAEKLGVTYLVDATVEELNKNYEIRLQLISGGTGMVVGTNRERCEICGLEEVGEKMSLAAASLRARLEALSRAPARIVVRTQPEGATVTVDDAPIGQTPVEMSLDAGTHRMVVERQGFSPLKRSFAVTSGIDEVMDLELLRLPSEFPFRAAGWVAIATGAALAIGGAYLIRMDGNEVSCSMAERDDLNHCPRVYRTNVPGATALGLAAVSATLGGVWLYLARPSGDVKGEDQAFRPSLTVGASGRF